MTRFVENVLRRDRAILVFSLAAITLLAWAYVINLAVRPAAPMPNDTMPLGEAMSMPNMQAWLPTDFGLTFMMWSIMMIAMMTPSAASMVLAFAGLKRLQRPEESVATPAFMLGYFVVWLSFSALATLLQWQLHSLGLLSSTMQVTPFISALLLIFAGIYQFTPFKTACLSNCRNPVGFFSTQWREGTRGALSMGVRHGLYCLGCCWPLMLVLFATGVMNLLWVAIIAAYVVSEKVIPVGRWLGQVIGLLTIGWGLWVFTQAL